MAIQQTKRQSDLEKRLQLLRRQVYGKGPENSVKSDKTRDDRKDGKPEGATFRYTDTPTHRNTDTLASSDLTYLRQDLLRIATFASFAIGAQVLLFFILKNNILKINLF